MKRAFCVVALVLGIMATVGCSTPAVEISDAYVERIITPAPAHPSEYDPTGKKMLVGAWEAFSWHERWRGSDPKWENNPTLKSAGGLELGAHNLSTHV